MKEALVHRERHVSLAKKNKVIKAEELEGKMIGHHEEGFNEESIRMKVEE